MKKKEINQINNSRSSSKLFTALGGAIAASVLVMILRELPAMRRELKILRM
jgi:hypothetical protein